jgi:hypothetical protein
MAKDDIEHDVQIDATLKKEEKRREGCLTDQTSRATESLHAFLRAIIEAPAAAAGVAADVDGGEVDGRGDEVVVGLALLLLACQSMPAAR